jgi:hypothetical protein
MAKARFRTKAYLLYEGDQWLSRDSMELRGAFSRKDELKKAARKVIAEQAREHLEDFIGNGGDEDTTQTEVCREMLNELMENGQTYGYTTNYSIESVTLNELQ